MAGSKEQPWSSFNQIKRQNNNMASVRLKRTNENNNSMRDYKIFIDGKEVGRIANGETKDFPMTDGQHIITAKIDWCSSQDFPLHIKDNETKELKVGGFKNGNWIMPLAGGIIALHFLFKIMLHIEYTIFLVIPVFILLVYYLTIGRKKYLTLEEINDK
jgi:hypothetical protein